MAAPPRSASQETRSSGVLFLSAGESRTAELGARHAEGESSSVTLRLSFTKSEALALLRADRVSFAYGAEEVLHDVSLAVPRGGLTGVLGPNGSGKTTLLKLLGGLLRPTSGQVQLGDDDLAVLGRDRLAKQMAMVPQETHLAFDYSVLEIALMGRYPYLGPFELEGPDDLVIVREALMATGTGALEQRGFTTLSGGEKQRVIIASALAQLRQPQTKREDRLTEGVLLLDEPTASLDLAYQLEIAATLRSLNERRGTTMVVSTHDLNFAASVCDRLVLLRAGRVLAAGPTAQVLSAETVGALYDVKADVQLHAAAGHLTVVPISRLPRTP